MAWVWQSAPPAVPLKRTVVEWKGSFKDYDGVQFEMYAADCCENGCSSCCANGLLCFLTWGTCICKAPQFTIAVDADGMGGVAKDAKMCGCAPISPIPCFNGCGYGPCAFVTPFTVEHLENGEAKWVGNGQVVAAGCCPCMNNIGDYGVNSTGKDGSSPDKYHTFYPVSMFWPPCVNGVCAGKDADNIRMTQMGVGKPVVSAAGAPGGAQIAR